ncbi:MAG: sce7725 family protein [Armatimonadota bacterium]
MYSYYPYFRGKQYELITVRENAKLLKESGFVPIIEPVKESTNGLKRAIGEIREAGGRCILIVNPDCGDHCADSRAIEELFEKDFADVAELSVGILLTSPMSIHDIESLCDKYPKRDVTLVHCGFEEASSLAIILANHANVTRHVFIEDFCGKRYRRHFNGENESRILVRDGFQKRTNKDHPKLEPFSELHATFREESMDGFGDFLIVGNDYSESGGPAYAVAIHLTYIDYEKDEMMYIRHFKSDRTDTPTDPAGKFAEALNKLAAEVNGLNSPILKTNAVMEFLDLHDSHHFPGLGYVKKLSMQHHIETLAHYFNQQ